MRAKLTKEITEVISKRLKVGCYAKMAAIAIGIDEEKIYRKFCKSVRQSEAEGETTLIRHGI